MVREGERSNANEKNLDHLAHTRAMMVKNSNSPSSIFRQLLGCRRCAASFCE